MASIESLRKEIDSIDKKLVELFEKRMSVAQEIADYKKENNFPIFDKFREEEVLKKNILYLKNKNIEKEVEDFFKNIMKISKIIQKEKLNAYLDEEYTYDTSMIQKDNLRVGFQGVPGSFSEQALFEYFGDNVDKMNFNSFEDIFIKLKNDYIDYGVLPIENSSTGGISDVYDLLRKHGLSIIGERAIKVEHNLLALKGTKIEDIQEVYSHTQAFQQSSDFFKQYPDIKLIPYSNTAISAKYIKEENSNIKAGVASKKAAELYDLEILRENINQNKSNYTRFIIIGKNLEINKSCNKISILLSLPHEAGSLYNVLKHFANNNLNMLKIESRPILDKSWEYFFYIDFEGNLNDEAVKKSIQSIKNNSTYFKLLGNYKRHTLL